MSQNVNKSFSTTDHDLVAQKQNYNNDYESLNSLMTSLSQNALRILHTEHLYNTLCLFDKESSWNHLEHE